MRVNGGKAIVSNVIKAVEIARQRDFLVVWVNFLPFLLPTSTSLSLSIVWILLVCFLEVSPGMFSLSRK